MKCLILLLVVCVTVCCAQRIVENKDVLACHRHLECMPNEVYNCCGVCFELTCDNQSRNRSCDARCYKGCYCADGYTRRWAGGGCVRDAACSDRG
uniref:TIL domain-containing protein n=1 Tax=Anopheles christyi TaxID=43041 RepID=A0A182K9P2_9DIPT